MALGIPPGLDSSDYGVRQHEAELHRRFLTEAARLTESMRDEVEDAWKICLSWEDLAAEHPGDAIYAAMVRVSRQMLNKLLINM